MPVTLITGVIRGSALKQPGSWWLQDITGLGRAHDTRTR